ncbi:hypothetical protein ACLB2K_031971 [Fragaria x ananassa]
MLLGNLILFYIYELITVYHTNPRSHVQPRAEAFTGIGWPWHPPTWNYIHTFPCYSDTDDLHLSLSHVMAPPNLVGPYNLGLDLDRTPCMFLCLWMGTKLSKSFAYHPQSDGQTENLNRTVEQYLRGPPMKHSGVAPPSIKPYAPGSTSVAEVDQQLRSREELLAVL